MNSTVLAHLMTEATPTELTEVPTTGDDDKMESVENVTDHEIEEVEQLEEEDAEAEAEEEEGIRSSFPTWKDLDMKYKLLIVSCAVVLIAIGLTISIMLAVALALVLFSVGAFQWFSSTNLSVEITVFLARFFPPAAHPVIDCRKTPECAWSKAFRDNWQVIYREYLEYEAKYNYCPEMDAVYPNGSITNWDRKWPTVNLRVYGLDTQIAQYFPKTMALVNASDTWLSHAMFSILQPTKFIPRHRGPYRGVFRYHLHLEIPEHKNFEDELYMAVWPGTSSADFWPPENVPDNDPILLKWTDGDDFLFDDTCVHEVINFTKKRRIILFMDVERYDISFFAKRVHRFFMGLAKHLPAVRNCKAVQDEYFKKCLDEKTNTLKRYMPEKSKCTADGLDEDMNAYVSPSNSWLFYNTPPEILPYKRARMVIANHRQGNQQTQ